MAESITERVARAISNAAYDDKAKAAIGAMREPTEEMLSAVRISPNDPDPIKVSWQAMIDKALEDG